MTDKEFDACMARMRTGDKQALREVYEAYLSYIYAVVLGMVNRKETAEDVTSEFFIKLWDVADTYKPGGGHRAWLARIARNLAIDTMRKTKREVLSEEFEGLSSAADENRGGVSRRNAEGSLASVAETSSSVESEVVGALSVREALQRLGEKEREVVRLKVLGELSFKEIAQLLEEPMGTVTWRYQSAMKKLRRCGYE